MKKKGFLLVSLMMMTLLHVDASIAVPWNTTTSGWDEEEFSLDSHFRRMLYDVSQSQVGKAGNAGQPASTCKQTQNYRTCLPDPITGGPRRQPCDGCNRNC
ncbi:hypothetical protein SESBI_25075 [Sesbania bispinosa]|nr:hypothetical protein SESBI_25075 [Sesbania bispinosa]